MTPESGYWDPLLRPATYTFLVGVAIMAVVGFLLAPETKGSNSSSPANLSGRRAGRADAIVV